MQPSVQTEELLSTDRVLFDTHPGEYKHWALSIEGSTATLSMAVNEDEGLKPGYKLKLNSYDLGVDIELYDAINRIRFEHPTVKCVVITSAKERMFCSGANIYMLGQSSHPWKVNFCKFTNETRNGIEDSSRHDGIKFLAAINGTVAGGGYELALACDKLLMIDDRSSSVSLPEVPLLGVLPGTGGLTRVIDKRKVRRDLADVFCSTSEGVRAERAKTWGLVDEIAKPNVFDEARSELVSELSSQSNRPKDAIGVELTKLHRTIDNDGIHYSGIDVVFNRASRTASFIIKSPPASVRLTSILFIRKDHPGGHLHLRENWMTQYYYYEPTNLRLELGFSEQAAVSQTPSAWIAY
jgi:benzoyl-CoA-dihydrodiol lyase